MLNKIEKVEKNYLESVKEKLVAAIDNIDKNVDNYAKEVHRGLLYIACTRAMHRLNLMHVKDISAFVSVA
jgi:DNA helicase IV